jgi:hypothetical protein
MAAIHTKKPTNPTNVTPSITLEAGESRPSHPAKTPVKMPTQPTHRGTARVCRAAHAYRGTTTPQTSASPI